MSRVLTSEPFRHEDVHKFSDEFFTFIAKQLFDVSVHQHDASAIVHQDDAARRGFRRQAKFLLRLLAFRYVQ